MPFTPTHIAAAVPIAWLSRWRIPFTALAIGTMIPDLGVFFPELVDYRASHSIVGLLTHCLPLGLAAYYLYHVVYKRPLADLLPASLRDRLHEHIDRDIDFSMRQVALVAGLVVIGAATHVFWDTFTHVGRWGVRTIPQLNEIAFQWQRWPVRWYLVLQHVSSALVLPPLLIGFIRWVRKQDLQPARADRFHLSPWISWTNLFLVFVGAAIQTIVKHLDHPMSLVWLHTLRTIVRNSGAVMLFMVIAYGLAMNLVWYIQERRETTATVNLAADDDLTV